jgi:DNA-binding transcriptional regulator YdaS (Cro superfamily)
MSEIQQETDPVAAGLAEAKKAVGGNTGLAKALGGGISPQAISQWKRIPAERVPEVERVTGVPRHRQRPDIFEVPASAQVAEQGA